MSDFPWLTPLILVPLVGALVAAGLPQTPGGAVVKQVGLGFSLLTVAVGVGIATQYYPGEELQLTEERTGSSRWASTTPSASTASA